MAIPNIVNVATINAVTEVSVLTTTLTTTLVTAAAEYANKIIEKGFNFVTVGSDQRSIGAGAKNIVEKIKGSSNKEESKTY